VENKISIYLSICRIVGVYTVKFHCCRAGNPCGKLFTVNGCPAGQVIDIQYAEVGYSQKYNPSANMFICVSLEELHKANYSSHTL